MQYETYKLGKLKKNPIRRLYTREELESFELPRLREICRMENIKPPTMEILHHKEELARLLYRYLGAIKNPGIAMYLAEGCQRLEEAFEKKEAQSCGGIEVPARMELYQGQASLYEKESPYIVTARQELGSYAFLADEAQKVQAILLLDEVRAGKYRLRLDRERMSPDLPAGRFHQWELLFLEQAQSEEAVRCYQGRERRRSILSCIRVPVPEVWVKEVPQSEEPLIIDYGTSYTTAGTCFQPGNGVSGETVLFPAAADCEERQAGGCQNCALCPSVLAVKDCSDGIAEHMTFLYGEEAVQEEKNRGYLARNSIFYDMKRWVGRYRERIQVTDLEGNTCEVERLFLVRSFLLYVIDRAQQQNRVRYPKLCFTCPVKQKTLSLRMYQEALPEYEVMTKYVTDEAVAVAYHFLEQSVRNLDYQDGAVKKMLILDCGGGTSDMVSCNYRITNEGITSRLEMHVTYAHGDTNFGGNHLTWRVMQYLKIRLAEVLRRREPASMDRLFPGVLSQLYDKVDEEGVEKAYSTFSGIYEEAETWIPTCFANYQNQPEHLYLKVRGNYFFLWNLAETVKKKLYGRQGICKVALRQLFSEVTPSGCFEDFHLFVRKEKGGFETRTLCPELVVEKEEANLLLKPDIYGFLKNFIEPWYESGRLMDIDRIILSGQSSKIGLFREVMKEYVAGRKAKAGGESGCERKLLCMGGAVAYQQDRRTGRIRTAVSYEPARAPYSVTAEDYETPGRQKTLLAKGTPMGEVYGYLSRPTGTEEIWFHLKDGMEKEVLRIPYAVQEQGRTETGYGELLSQYPLIRQEDLDSMQNGELRLFLFADDENWGFCVLETAREANRLYLKSPGFVPFEPGAWETDFFDGRH
ncbi:MAG: hypothetical protein K2N87_12400 [Eubacterium sp.]|nr:hypothetical protein [Eubacterium sp.]